METFFKDLFSYNNLFNSKIIDVLNENKNNISENSIRLICHIVNVHRIWNYKIKPGENPLASWDSHRLIELSEINKINFNESIIILGSFQLNSPINYSLSTGQRFTNSVQDILFQIINHSTYHRGQIAKEFKNAGLEPLLTDYIFYKMK